MDSTENPMLSLSVRIWSQMGFILESDYRKYIYLVPNFILNALQLSFLCFSGENIESLILNGYFFVLYFNCLLRAINAITLRHAFERFLADFCELYDEIQVLWDCRQRHADQVTMDILMWHSQRAELFAKLNLILGIVASACFASYPLVAGNRDLPYGIYVPGVDYRQSPLYETVFVIQAVITFTGCCLYIPFSNLFTSFMLFGIVLTKTLQHKFQTIAAVEPKYNGTTICHETIERELKQCIEYHKRIIRYVQEMNYLVSHVCLIELLVFGLLLCALLFLMNIVTRVAQLIIAASYIFLIMVQLFTLYWHANELMVESLDLCNVVYGLPWYRFNIQNRRLLVFLIARVQRPLQVMIGSMYPITLQMFQSLLNASYTYVTLLRRAYN